MTRKSNKKSDVLFTKKQMAAVFTEWAARFAKNPSEFESVTDKSGQPAVDYGVQCALYFVQIADELDEAGLLPEDDGKDDLEVTKKVFSQGPQPVGAAKVEQQKTDGEPEVPAGQQQPLIPGADAAATTVNPEAPAQTPAESDSK